MDRELDTADKLENCVAHFTSIIVAATNKHSKDAKISKHYNKLPDSIFILDKIKNKARKTYQRSNLLTN